MGCDIHSYAERKDSAGRWTVVSGLRPFDSRNYSDVTPLVAPRGMPSDASREVADAYEGWGFDAHTPTWLTLAELLAVDYDQLVEDRRTTGTLPSGIVSGGCTAAPGQGETMPLREFLGQWFMADLKALQEAGAERIVLWFDN